MASFLVNGALRANTSPPLDNAALEGLLLRIGSRRAQSLQDSVRNEAAENRASNARVSQLNEVLQSLNAVQPNEDTNNNILRAVIPQPIIDILASIPVNGGPARDSNAFSAFITSGTQQRLIGDSAFSRLRETVRTEIDQASSDSQLNLIRLQGIINRSNQATEFVTNVVQRFSGVEDRINPNFR